MTSFADFVFVGSTMVAWAQGLSASVSLALRSCVFQSNKNKSEQNLLDSDHAPVTPLFLSSEPEETEVVMVQKMGKAFQTFGTSHAKVLRDQRAVEGASCGSECSGALGTECLGRRMVYFHSNFSFCCIGIGVVEIKVP